MNFRWCIGFFTLLYSYYTNWTLLMLTLWFCKILPSSMNYSLLLMLYTSSVGGFYITYIHPQKVCISCFPRMIQLDGLYLKISDFLSHHAPLILCKSRIYIPPDRSCLPFFIISCLYLYIHSLVLYDLTLQDLRTILFMTFFLNFLTMES